MTKSIIDSMGIYETFSFFDHFHLEMNLEKSLLSKWNFFKSYVDLMFVVSNEDVLSSIYNQAMTMCKDSNESVMILIKLMENRQFGVPYLIDHVKGTFGLRGSSFSEANHSSVQNVVI